MMAVAVSFVTRTYNNDAKEPTQPMLMAVNKSLHKQGLWASVYENLTRGDGCGSLVKALRGVGGVS